MDPTIKYKVLQEQKQRQQILEMRIENIKQAKKEADQKKLYDKKMRVQARIQELEMKNAKP